MNGSSLRTATQFAIGLAITALVLHTWLLMGLIVPVVVAGDSMAPTLNGGGRQRVIIDRTAFVLRQPRRWEVIVFRCPSSADQFCVKRIVGLPGETVTLAGGELSIDGQWIPNPLNGPDVPADVRIAYRVRRGDRPELVDDRDAADFPWPGPAAPGRAASWTLGPEEFFVIGDNAAVSDDSRSWVPKAGLDAKLVLGKPLGVR